MAPATKYTIAQYIKIATAIACTLAICKSLKDASKEVVNTYIGVQMFMQKQAAKDAGQDYFIIANSSKMLFHDSTLAEHTRRLDRNEIGIELLELHDPKSRFNAKR